MNLKKGMADFLSKLFLLLVFGPILIICAAYNLLPSTNLKQIGYAEFTALLQTLILFLSLMGMILIVFFKNSKKTIVSFRWLPFSTLFTLSLVIFSIIYINPYGIYPWNISPVYLAGGARAIKLYLYNNASPTPKIIIAGSSRAHQLEAEYIQQIYGKPSFNWSVEGSGPIDTLTSMNYLAQSQNLIPDVLIMEISHILVSPSWQERTPLTLVPLLPKKDMANDVIKTQAKYLFSFRALAESLYSFFYVYDKYPPTFSANGTAIAELPDDNTIYQTLIQNAKTGIAAQLSCAQLYPDGQDALTQLVKLAQEKKFSIVFYISPLNADFLDTLDISDPVYKNCQNLIDSYVKKLADGHPNIFYRNLSTYKPLSDLRKEGFGDIEHIDKFGARLLIDTLSPEIKSAIQWAKSQK